MRRLFLAAICLFLLCQTASAANIAQAMLGVCNGAATTFCGTTGASDTVCENFDSGTTTCGDDAASQANCNTTWTKAYLTGTINNQAVGLEGTYAKYMNATNDSSPFQTSIGFSATNAYAFVRAKYGVLTGTKTASYQLVGISASGDGATLCSLGMAYDTDKIKFVVYANGSAQTPIESIVPAEDTEYFIWLDFVKGTSCTVYIAENGTKPAATGTYEGANTSAGTFFLRAWYAQKGNSFDEVFYDRIRISASGAFGDDAP